MDSEQVLGATASLQGSIQALSETVELQRSRADLAEAKLAEAQKKLHHVRGLAVGVGRKPFRLNDPMDLLADAILRILDAES